MAKKITVSLSFDFYPETEHGDLFEGMSEERAIEYAKSMAHSDIIHGTDLYRMMDVIVKEEE
jgi:hypothetical protein